MRQVTLRIEPLPAPGGRLVVSNVKRGGQDRGPQPGSREGRRGHDDVEREFERSGRQADQPKLELLASQAPG